MQRRFTATGPDRLWFTDIAQHRAADDLVAVAHALNTRPRKTLGWRTPAEALDEKLHSLHEDGVATAG